MLEKVFVKTSIKSQSIRIMGALLLCSCLQSAVIKAEVKTGADSLAVNNHQVNDSNYISNRVNLHRSDSVSNRRRLITDTSINDAIYIHDVELNYKDNVKVVYKYNSSKRAVVYSMLVPGLGQIYNKKYWKLPIIYGGAAVIYFFYDYNNTYYQRFKKAYEQRVDYTNMKSDYVESITEYNEEHPDNPLTLQWNEYEPVDDQELQYMSQSALALNRDHYRRQRDYNLIYFALLYVANVVDAMVDSYMIYYDVSDDLSFNIEPYIYPTYSNTNNKNFSPTCGLSLKLNFK